MAQADVATRKKNARRQKALIVFQDESGLSLIPPLCRTWAPRGETPIIRHSFAWKKLSMSGALAYRWDGSFFKLVFQIIPGSYRTDTLVNFLELLARQCPNRRIILIWDKLPAHRSRLVAEAIARLRRIEIVWLPGYAPELNPTEYIWANIKRRELANRESPDLGLLRKTAWKGIRRVRRRQTLPLAFLQHAGLLF